MQCTRQHAISRRAPQRAMAQAQAVRSYRCCPGLDGAPPDKVVIEYDPEDVDM